jgi:mRNA interferase RelE/StbE
MNYQIDFKPRAIKDLQSIAPKMRERILAGLEKLQDNLSGDVKHLTNFTPEYRLRVGNYRALFEIEGDTVVVYRILPRQAVYAKGKHR